jgi:hypothetical protein
MMEISFGQKESIKLDLANDLREVKYYIAGDTGDNEAASVKSSDERTASMSFLAVKVEFSKSSGSSYPAHYIPNGPNLPILVEFRSDTECTELLQMMEGLSSLRPYFDKQARLSSKAAEIYCKPFIDSNAERTMGRNSIGSPTSRNTQGFLAGRKEEDILIEYPFAGDDELIEKCAKGLNEASRGGSCHPNFSSEKEVAEEFDSSDLVVSDEEKALSRGSDKGEAELETKTLGPAHLLTVRVEDYGRLEPGEYLNDTLIDFWMRWYVAV